MLPKSLFAYFIALGVVVVGIGAFVVFDYSERQSANLANILPTPEPLCDNQDEVEDFVEPVPVVWTARLDGCLVSCEGASFTRVPEDEKYPRFAGYSPDLLKDSSLWQSGDVLEIQGGWLGIGADHPFTVFENKCVPIVQIESIRAIE